MRPFFFSREHTCTKYIILDTSKCRACWECIESCPNNVINKIDLPWHKHAIVADPGKCTGCLKCVKTCQYQAYSKTGASNRQTAAQQTVGPQTGGQPVSKFIINNLLLLFGLLTIVSGLALQLGFHVGGGMGHAGRQMIHLQVLNYEQIRNISAKSVLGLGYHDWSVFHKYVVVFFSLLAIYHIYKHWKFYKAIIIHHLVGSSSCIAGMSVLFIITAVTGLVSWFIYLSGGNKFARFELIEIHDKLALVLAAYIIWHIIKKQKWFISSWKKNKIRV
jgi:2-oxoglutarate ferredoxin oxidoreductase subunit delta